MMPTTSLEMI